MSFNRIYTRERAEELRSRMSLMESTLLTLKEDFWTIFQSIFSKGQCPPFLYPASTFQSLENVINSLSDIINTINPDGLILEMVNRYNGVDGLSRIVLDEVVKLQNVLSQRTTGLGSMKLSEFHLFSQLECGAFLKVYAAVDAVTFELIKRMLGPSWIKDYKYIPISLFDSSGYMINIYSFIISIPYYDIFRSRFWPAMPHEVAHIVAHEYSRRRTAIRDTMLDGVTKLMELLGYYYENPYGRMIASSQITELTSDIIATYVCPATLLSATNILPISAEEEPNVLKPIFRNLIHPPTDARLAAMKKILEKSDILSVDEDLNNFVSAAETFFARKNLAVLGTFSCEFMIEYDEFARDFANALWNTLSHTNIKLFDKDEWIYTREALHNPDQNRLSPVQLLNLAWLKRMNAVKRHSHLTMGGYFLERMGEPQLFDQIVNLLYKYYEEELIGKAQVVDAYDLRLNIS